jgi:MFS family permease
MSTAVDNRDEQLVRGYSGILFLAMSVAWVGIEIGRQVLPPLLPTIIDELAITPFLAGFGLTVMWGTYALLHYPAGRFADKLSRKTILIGGLIVLSIGFFALGVASTYLIFIFALMTIGGGTAFYFIAMRLLVADLFVVKRAQALGIQLAFGQFGSALAAGVAIVVLTYLSWRGAFIPVGVILLGILVFLHRWIDEPYVIKPVSFGLRETVSRVMCRFMYPY